MSKRVEAKIQCPSCGLIKQMSLYRSLWVEDPATDMVASGVWTRAWVYDNWKKRVLWFSPEVSEARGAQTA